MKYVCGFQGCTWLFFPSEGTAGMQFNEDPREEQIGERKFGNVWMEQFWFSVSENYH